VPFAAGGGVDAVDELVASAEDHLAVGERRRRVEGELAIRIGKAPDALLRPQIEREHFIVEGAEVGAPIVDDRRRAGVGAGGNAIRFGAIGDADGAGDRFAAVGDRQQLGVALTRLRRRATLHFTNKDYRASLADIRQVLAREPRHFGALSGLGTIMQELGDDKGALEAYRRALAVHPKLEKIPELVKKLTEKVEGREI